MPRKNRIKSSSSASVASSGSSGSSEQDVGVEVQSKTFTRWMNDKLHGTGHRVSHIFKDLADGLVLISLLEVLSGRKVQGK